MICVMSKRIAVLVFALTVSLTAVNSQVKETTLTRLQGLSLPELSGSVSVNHSPSARERALAYQNSLGDAYTWFEQQLDEHVPIMLAVLDQEAYPKLKGPDWPMPYSDPDSGASRLSLSD